MYKTSAKVGCKLAKVEGLKESQLTIKRHKDQGLVSSEELWTSPVI